jgi:hypothetical protein
MLHGVSSRKAQRSIVFLSRLSSDRLGMTALGGHPVLSCHASGGGGTIERPLAASTIDPSAGQYIRQAVQPG